MKILQKTPTCSFFRTGRRWHYTILLFDRAKKIFILGNDDCLFAENGSLSSGLCRAAVCERAEEVKGIWVVGERAEEVKGIWVVGE